MKAKARTLPVIAGLLKTLHRDKVIESGELLLEAQEQQEYGDFLEWVEENFDGSFSTAYNHMAAAKLAARFPTVGNLRLRASALYTLGLSIEGGRWDQAVIDAIFAEAEVTWVNADRAQEIWDLHNKTEEDETEEETDDTTDDDDTGNDDDTGDDDDGDDGADEAKKIAGGPPPDLPPPQAQPTGRAEEMWHSQTIDRCMTMSTKPFATFIAMAGRVPDIIKISQFMAALAEHLAKEKRN
jgi:hypothetical protein